MYDPSVSFRQIPSKLVFKLVVGPSMLQTYMAMKCFFLTDTPTWLCIIAVLEGQLLENNFQIILFSTSTATER